MTDPSSLPDEAAVHWHIVINHKTGRFLNRMCISHIDAKLANEMHYNTKSGIHLYLEADAVKYFPSTHPLEFEPGYKKPNET